MLDILEVDLDLASSFADFAVLRAMERKSLRRSVRTECEVVAEDGFRLLGTYTLDLSEDGLLLDAGAPCVLGEPVIVSLKMPRGASWIDAEGHVARAIDGQRRGDCGPALGIAFDGMSQIDRAILRASLHGIPPAIPRRHARMDYAATVGALR
ncbi:MAG: PilZ domain-containing protein [Sandaracinus sp.]|nr:PilZ domain-containing protein [Sandaracinus sp.]MCB9619663.1 PilZ domain-containing protein [Sandaracinus sp.]MCB9636412.1 PilZ domain-containing protein [Sandaracinus sp.]